MIEAPVMEPAKPSSPFGEISRTAQPLICAGLVMLGAAVMLGWLLGIEPLKSLAPGLSTMKFNTAIGFVITGIGLAAATYHRSAAGAALATASGAMLSAIGIATIYQYSTGADLGIDQLFAADRGTLQGSGHAGRMSWLTATAWTAVGAALMLLGFGRTRFAVAFAHLLTGYAGFVALLAAAGYTFGAEAFFGIGIYTQIAVHTAVGLMFVAAAGLMTRANDGWLKSLEDSPVARALLRRLLPLAVLVPAGLGLLLMLCVSLGLFNAPFAFAAFIPVTVIAMVIGSLWIAGKQREAELRQLQYERHLQMLVGELNHRVKNTLSIVQSIAHQTLTDGASPAEARAAFNGRLQALASAHNLLTQQNWDNLPLSDLLQSVLSVYQGDGDRFEYAGPPIALTPKASVTLAIAAHELATNAAKYGSLSVPQGKVRLTWTNRDGEFQFRWKEFDGPPCLPPSRQGFGTRMLDRALASEMGGTGEISYHADGLEYQLRCPAL